MRPPGPCWHRVRVPAVPRAPPPRVPDPPRPLRVSAPPSTAATHCSAGRAPVSHTAPQQGAGEAAAALCPPSRFPPPPHCPLGNVVAARPAPPAPRGRGLHYPGGAAREGGVAGEVWAGRGATCGAGVVPPAPGHGRERPGAAGSRRPRPRPRPVLRAPLPPGRTGRGLGRRLRDPHLQRGPQRGGGGGGGRPPVAGGRRLQRRLGGGRAAVPRAAAGAGPRLRHVPGGVRRLRQHRGAGAGRSPAPSPRALGNERRPGGRGAPPAQHPLVVGAAPGCEEEEEEEGRAGALLPPAPRGDAPAVAAGPAARHAGGRGGGGGLGRHADGLVHERIPHRLLRGPPGRPGGGCRAPPEAEPPAEEAPAQLGRAAGPAPPRRAGGAAAAPALRSRRGLPPPGVLVAGMGAAAFLHPGRLCIRAGGAAAPPLSPPPSLSLE